MSGLLYNLGRKVGPKARKAKWMWQSIAGNEADAIKAEQEVGHDLAHEIRHQLAHDEKTGRILTEVGHRLAACVTKKSRTFRFETLKGTEPNAFALPGGYIFVTRSIIELCQWNRDEVAFILAHEMAHVIRGHAMDRIISNSVINAASRAAPTRGRLSGLFRRKGVQFLQSVYSRDLETEADKLGVQLVAAAGYKPHACVQLLSRLAKLSSADSKLNLGNYFSSHPSLRVRIHNLNRLLQHFHHQEQIVKNIESTKL